LHNSFIEVISERGRFQTPLPSVPAKIFASHMTKALTGLFANPTWDQLVPLFVDRYTPPLSVAKIFVPLIAKAKTSLFVNPLFTEVQLSPLSVDRYTP
jgi:hypothetical protein